MDLQIFAGSLIIAVGKDRIRHFRDHKQHSGVVFVECEVSRTRAVGKADAAVCGQKLSFFAVKLIDIDHVETEIADEDFVSLAVESREVGVGTLLAVRGVKADAAVLAGVGERAEASVTAQRKQGGTSAPVVGAEQESAARIGADVAGAAAGAGEAVQDRKPACRVGGGGFFPQSRCLAACGGIFFPQRRSLADCGGIFFPKRKYRAAVRCFAERVQSAFLRAGQVGGIRDALHRVQGGELQVGKVSLAAVDRGP